MPKISSVVEVDGTPYIAKFMTVQGTRLGNEDHGILTFLLDCKDDNGNAVGVGGYTLDAPVPGERHRAPTASGFALIIEVMRTVGADSWEDIRGKNILVLFENSRSVGIANPLTGKVLVFGKFLEGFKDKG
ncbi:MAG: hypothetical protein E6R04_06800 [Spirochaetes bacterium]|nr:MAG: hypothetical protein E6R04_06800 [Spirochaetota bacterium]